MLFSNLFKIGVTLFIAMGLAIVIGALQGCATSPTGRNQLMIVSDGEVAASGVTAFEEMKKQKPIETDPNTNNYVRCIANSVSQLVAKKTGIQDWEVIVFKDPTANAFALPGGKIGVHTGILPVANTQDQLAAVLGHEVGHVLARHSAARMSQALVVQGSLTLVDILLDKKDPNHNLLLGALGIGAQYGILLPFSRGDESEADEIGLYLMAEAGYDPHQAVQLWNNMSHAGAGNVPQFLSDHPSNENRIRNLEKKMPRALALYQQAQAAGFKPSCARFISNHH